MRKLHYSEIFFGLIRAILTPLLSTYLKVLPFPPGVPYHTAIPTPICQPYTDFAFAYNRLNNPSGG